MKKKIENISKVLVFVVVFVLLFLAVTQVFVDKSMVKTDDWPTTSTMAGFYDMEENTVDVIFLGSSHAFAAFNPQELYNEYGLTSYNLGSGQQNMLVSYYWLEEALKYQSPQAVVLDCMVAFPYETEEVLNSSEENIRKAIDPMKFSSTKWNAIQDICSYDSEQTITSYLFPLLRYHERWKELDEDDFSYSELVQSNELKGYSALKVNTNPERFAPVYTDETIGEVPFDPIQEKYLEKIVSLCKENGIQLVLTRTPYYTATTKEYNRLVSFAQENGLIVVDYNLRQTQLLIDYDNVSDQYDLEHANLQGATKITDYMGEILTTELGVTGDGVDEQYEVTKEYYLEKQTDAILRNSYDPAEFISLLQNERYDVFITTMGDYSTVLTDEIITALQGIGVDIDFSTSPKAFYVAMLEGTIDQCGTLNGLDETEITGVMRDGYSNYSLVASERVSHIYIDDTEYSRITEGINIVVYNPEERKVLDQAVILLNEDGEIELSHQ